MIPADNIAGRIAEAILPGKKVRSLTLRMAVQSLAVAEAEIYVGDELRLVEGIIGDRPSWRFIDIQEKTTLTDAEREAIDFAWCSVGRDDALNEQHADRIRETLERLLDRTK